MTSSPERETRPITRRRLLEVTCGLGLFAAGAALGNSIDYFKHPGDVQGFTWQNHSFEDPHLRTADAAPTTGDRHADSPLPSHWHKAAIIGASVASLLKGWREKPNANLGVAYTDPGGKWHEGWAEPGQPYGRNAMYADQQHLTVAVLEGRKPAYFTFALINRESKGHVTRLQIPTVLHDEIYVGDVPAGTPVL